MPRVWPGNPVADVLRGSTWSRSVATSCWEGRRPVSSQDHPELVARLRRNPMFRALRLDKVIYQALESTLRNLLLERYELIPAVRMIAETAESIRRRAETLLEACPALNGTIEEGASVIGGGSTPEQSIPTWLIAVPSEDAAGLERKLRTGTPPVIARIENDRLLLDLRTVFPEEEAELANALQALS